MPDELPADDPRAAHLGVYQWLTFVQDSLVHGRMQVRERSSCNCRCGPTASP